MIKVILWDVDGTLLDFLAAEKNALRQCFAKFGLGPCSDARIGRYSKINRSYWERLERGEITKQQVLVGRYEEFFAAEGLRADPAAFNAEYQAQLGETICFIDQSYELLSELRSRVKQYAVTNGTYTAQKRKLEKSGLIHIFDGVFISDQIGAEKPGKAFFDYVFEHIGPYEKEEILMVGDSLTSDMRGGNLAGLPCCWYNPDRLPVPQGLRIDYNIQNLNQIKDLFL